MLGSPRQWEWEEAALIWGQTVPATGCVALGKLLHLSELRFPLLENAAHNVYLVKVQRLETMLRNSKLDCACHIASAQ